MANAEVQRRRVEIDTMKWCFARMQPRGIRNNVEDTNQVGNITISWGGGTDDTVMQPVQTEKQATDNVVKLVETN